MSVISEKVYTCIFPRCQWFQVPDLPAEVWPDHELVLVDKCWQEIQVMLTGIPETYPVMIREILASNGSLIGWTTSPSWSACWKQFLHHIHGTDQHITTGIMMKPLKNSSFKVCGCCSPLQWSFKPVIIMMSDNSQLGHLLSLWDFHVMWYTLHTVHSQPHTAGQSAGSTNLSWSVLSPLTQANCMAEQSSTCFDVALRDPVHHRWAAPSTLTKLNGSSFKGELLRMQGNNYW